MSKAILVVEDDFNLASTLSRVLQSAFDKQAKVEACGTAELALGRLYTESIDLLITDWDLPGMSGLVLMARARRAFPDLKIVFMTASPPTEIEEKLKRIADVYITKPFQVPVLVEQIQGLL